jgi:hypothetical protein
VGDYEKQLILRYADAVCTGQFPWFAYGPVSLGLPPQWNLDFVSGNTWPTLKTKAIQVVRHDGSDVKVPWELSRLQFLPIVAKAWHVSGDTRYRETGKALLLDWIKKNPAGIGVNWAIAMEAALRAISVCLFVELISPLSEAERSFAQMVNRSLWQHMLFIEAHNEFSHFVRSNHYLSNIVGLFCLSTHLEGPGMRLRRKHYKRLIEREAQRQVYEDGGQYEASAGYHVLCLEMFTHAYLLMRAQGIESSPSFDHRLREMYRFLAALTDARGHLPQLGDCDDGRVELFADDLEQMLDAPLDLRHSLVANGLLGIGECLFREGYAGRQSETPWYKATVPSRQQQAPTRPHSVLFVNSGLAVARKGNFEVVFAAMPNGIGGKGSHTHNDKLSAIVRIDGEELFSDSGTGCYTRDSQVRNQLRSTSAHNTIQIDNEEQNRFSESPDGLFRLSDDAHVSPIEVKEVDGMLVLHAGHTGYCRLGVTHRRTLKLEHQSLTVEDCLSSWGGHDFRAFFHLTKKQPVTIAEAHGKEVLCRISLDQRSVRMSCRANIDLELTCITTKVSSAYGLMREATTIVVSGRFHSPLTWSSSFVWES